LGYVRYLALTIKRVTRLMLGFNSFRTAQSTLAGIELVAMLKKGQMKKNRTGDLKNTALLFYPTNEKFATEPLYMDIVMS
jgi:hypothetical protein